MVGQWRKGKKWPLELVIVDNSFVPDVPMQGVPEPMTYELRTRRRTADPLREDAQLGGTVPRIRRPAGHRRPRSHRRSRGDPGILGPNGAGKSTLFNLIGGVLPPSSGRILLDGRDITGMKPWDRSRIGIGRTYQVPKPFTHMSVFENVLVAAVHGGKMTVPRARGECDAVLRRVGTSQPRFRPGNSGCWI